MPIVLFPNPVTPGGSSSLVTTVNADVSLLYDRPVPGKMRGVVVQQGRTVAIQIAFFDQYGNPVDLTQYGVVNTPGSTTSSVQMRLREAVGYNGVIHQIDGEVTNAAAGQVSFDLTGGMAVAVPAVYIADCGVLDSNMNVLVPDQVYVLCERTAFGVATPNGLPSSREVRLAMRDAPEYNLLLDHYQHDISEICQSLVTSVQYWNSQPPPIGRFVDTSNWPTMWRGQLLTGACSELHMIAASWYRRNENSVQAGGVAVTDLDKAATHEKAAAALWARYAEFVKTSRISINLADGFGMIGPGVQLGPLWW